LRHQPAPAAPTRCQAPRPQWSCQRLRDRDGVGRQEQYADWLASADTLAIRKQCEGVGECHRPGLVRALAGQGSRVEAAVTIYGHHDAHQVKLPITLAGQSLLGGCQQPWPLENGMSHHAAQRRTHQQLKADHGSDRIARQAQDGQPGVATRRPARGPRAFADLVVEEIYLDYNASTPIDPQVAEVMRSLLDRPYANPSAIHAGGRAARAIVDRARGQVASLLGCGPDEVVFTSGGSEADNLALCGVLLPLRDHGDHIITTAVEHPAILETARFLERLGGSVTYLEMDGSGRLDPEDVRRAITARTILVSVMHANNEVGTIEPIEAVSAITRERGILLHTDAAQSVGKIPTRVDELGVDLLSIAGHKLYAPKGVGALYVRRGVRLEPVIHGAGHEGGRRAGTESALLVAALGTACELAADLDPMDEVRRLRDLFWGLLQTRFGERVVLNGHPTHRLPNTISVSFVGHIGADILAALDDVAASTGSACHAGSVELSPVLRAMGVPPEVGMGAIRFSLGRGTTEAEVHDVVEHLDRAIAAGVGASFGGG